MAQEFLEDVVASYNEYCEWVWAGRKNEDLGDELLEDLIERMKNFFFVASDLDPISLKIAKGSSDLELTVSGNRLGIELPKSSEDGDVETRWIDGE
ncbi:hypothetical protein CF68_33195 [Cupriavidus sp. SK-4]|uniref:hypothetical protein n=1 Tax=Cupriavidus sp. SK-4 TaxID=574750 RepID=UPI00044D3F61|nr:hypothetical protein [Cupriavidus sp. SK-4]EYS89540.1 hypothetical protein CF68_33195 [Cupriavidus sp. SK-4]